MMEELRRDAARNRARILVAAREATDRGEALAMNAIARAADVGVGTVYRHFATVAQLEEVVVWDRFDELERMLDESGPDLLDRTIAAHVALLVADPLFEAVTARPHPVLPETAMKRDALIAGLGLVLERARGEGTVRDDIDATAVLLLACGVAHSIRSASLSPDSAEAQLLLRILFRGFRPS
jgi:AcrR family transcriptional regulator